MKKETEKRRETKKKKKKKKKKKRKIRCNDKPNTWKITIKQSQPPNCIIEYKSTVIKF